MADTTLKTHPLVVIAATTVILTCLIAVGIMTGLVPSPLTRDAAIVEEQTVRKEETVREEKVASAPARTNRSTLTEERRARAPVPPRDQRRAATGATGGSAAQGAVARESRVPEPRVAAVCTHCGTVTSVRTITRQGEAGMVGPAVGGAVGGLIGNQIGGGSGKTAATIIGAAGGAAIGTEMERRSKSTTHHVVGVRLNDGSTRSFTFQSAPGYREGDRVRVVEGRLVRDS